MKVLAEGLQALAEHVAVLNADTALLRESGRHRSAKIIELLADEQAATAMTLFDLVRTGKLPNAVYRHLTRAVYVAAYDAALADLSEAQRFADIYRDQRYLDGPNDVDWIMYNELEHHRESSMYVDLVSDSEDASKLVWESPRHSVYAEPTSLPHRTSHVVSVLLALDAVGLTSLAGVEATKATWTNWRKASSLDDPLREIRWSEARKINSEIVAAFPDAAIAPIEQRREVVKHWLFPLTTLDFTMRKVTASDLVEKRKSHSHR